jgi:hypothetical protein
MEGANLTGARGVTSEELTQKALSLEGAILPDGSRYESHSTRAGVDNLNMMPKTMPQCPTIL